MSTNIWATPATLRLSRGATPRVVLSWQALETDTSFSIKPSPPLEVALRESGPFDSGLALPTNAHLANEVAIFIRCPAQNQFAGPSLVEVTAPSLPSVVITCVVDDLPSSTPNRNQIRQKLRAVTGIAKEVARILEELAAPYLRSVLAQEEIDVLTETISEKVREDFGALTKKDPAAQERIAESFEAAELQHLDAASFLYRVYGSMQAVLWYRIANEIYYTDLVEDDTLRRQIALEVLFPEGWKLTGIDIDPSARIGRRFVLDHGAGTVIGRHTTIGDDCCVLHSVNLGSGAARSGQFAVDDSQQRHPRIGNRVKIFGYASVLGPVVIGDDCEIGTRCLVTENLPPGAKTRIINQFQYTTGSANGRSKALVFGVIPKGPGLFQICGIDFHEPRSAIIVEPTDRPLPGLNVSISDHSPTTITVRIALASALTPSPAISRRDLILARLKVAFEGGGCLYISQAEGIRKAIETLLQDEDFWHE